MFDIVKKAEYWNALDNKRIFQALGGFSLKALDGLKHIQDAWMLSNLTSLTSSKVLEVGGANSRVLPALSHSNEKWNLDEFKGAGNGPTDIGEMTGITLIRRNLGESSNELPTNYFDVVFSISVIEHIAEEYHEDFWADHARIMKQGALGIHAVDLYVRDIKNPDLERRIDLYRNIPTYYGLKFSGHLTISRPVIFKCDMASNSDWGMWRWNKVAPSLIKTREAAQSVTLAMILEKD